MVRKCVQKRPAMAKAKEKSRRSTWTPCADLVRGQALAVGGPPLPPWPRHCHELLPGLTRLQEKFADGLQISVWSDCGGICAELFALKEIGQMLKTECGFNLTVLPYAYCDSDVQARQFTELNHQPVHVADNIFITSPTAIA